MNYCKFCGQSNNSRYDPWGFLVCLNCGSEDIIDFEDEEICESNQLNEAALPIKLKETNTIADIADCVPIQSIGPLFLTTDALNAQLLQIP
jgi:Fe2+ or Zn2+ uptake regulation protein